MLKIHNEARLLGDPIKEWDKCYYFLTGIQSESFNNFKDNARADVRSFDKFAELYSRAKQVKIYKDADAVSGRKRAAGSVETSNQQVAAATTSPSRSPKKRKGSTKGAGTKSTTPPRDDGNGKLDNTATDKHNTPVSWDPSKRMGNKAYARLYDGQKAHFTKLRAEWCKKHPEEAAKQLEEWKKSKKNATRNASALSSSFGERSPDDEEIQMGDSGEPSPVAGSATKPNWMADGFGRSAYDENNDDESLFDNSVEIAADSFDTEVSDSIRYLSAVKSVPVKSVPAKPDSWFKENPFGPKPDSWERENPIGTLLAKCNEVRESEKLREEADRIAKEQEENDRLAEHIAKEQEEKDRLAEQREVERIKAVYPDSDYDDTDEESIESRFLPYQPREVSAVKSTPQPSKPEVIDISEDSKIAAHSTVISIDDNSKSGANARNSGNEFGRHCYSDIAGISSLSSDRIIGRANNSQIGFAKAQFSILYKKWINKMIISPEVNEFWKRYETDDDKEGIISVDRLGEMIRFYATSKHPMTSDDFDALMRLDRKKRGYMNGEWSNSEYLHQWRISWRGVYGHIGDRRDIPTAVVGALFDEAFMKDKFYLSYHIGHPQNNKKEPKITNPKKYIEIPIIPQLRNPNTKKQNY